jgi:predicted membrane channel-forming protein YqfA (hemolysin III family)
VNHPLSHLEARLLLAFAGALLLSIFGPSVAQHAHYHAFADQRAFWGVPFASDVLSNVPFALGGLWGLLAMRAQPQVAKPGVQRAMASVFFVGLVLTALCSTVYHLQPNNAGLALDRLGMVVAFAGLLGLAVAERVSPRGAWVTTGLVSLAGPLSVAVWFHTGNLLPWSVLQVGGMVLVLALAFLKPVPGAWRVRLGVVIGVYAVAKLLELGDHMVFELSSGWVSGHSLKHAVAALAAWPVIRAVHNSARSLSSHTAGVQF